MLDAAAILAVAVDMLGRIVNFLIPAIAMMSFSPTAPASLFPLSSVRLLDSPFTAAVKANRTYLLALDPDRLLAPFRREAGLTPRKPSYGNWENIGLDGHTAGHYLSALSHMVASGEDTPAGELRRRLNYMVDELQACQNGSSDGYVGGVPGSRDFWKRVAAGDIGAFDQKWVPWYNLHKTFAGLRDAYLEAGIVRARGILIRLGDWAAAEVAGLSDDQMQRMLGYEQGGICETLADIYGITKDPKYLALAKRFQHQALLEPLERGEDKLTGLHANTQIPKVIGFERLASLDGDRAEDSAARFFWTDVTKERSTAFGGNSVSEHFNDPKDFDGMLESREGPETCNTYNMLRLTEKLFASSPNPAYADYYERALYNHILASIDDDHPGYVYFTPIRPGHYRTYSTAGESFWCCVGTGMENPGRYGQFVYAKAHDGVYLNLFIPSELHDPELGLRITQRTKFPDEQHSQLTVSVSKPHEFTIYVRHPNWVADKGEPLLGSRDSDAEGLPNPTLPLIEGEGSDQVGRSRLDHDSVRGRNVGDRNEPGFRIRVNGKVWPGVSTPSSYVAVRRGWKTGDRVDVDLPMRTTVERLPDGSDWVAIMHGPIVLASPTGTADQIGLFAKDGRSDHTAQGPMEPLDRMPSLLASAADLPKHVIPDPEAGPMRFRITGIAEPSQKGGILLEPFFRIQEERYQMYWNLTTEEGLAAQKAKVAEEERAKLARDRATIDRVAVGEQQPEVDHQMTGDGLDTGFFGGRRWRHGLVVRYTLDSHGEKTFSLAVTYSGSDSGRTFDVSVNGTLLASQALSGGRPGTFFEILYPVPASVIAAAKDGLMHVSFDGHGGLAGGLYDVRLLRSP